MSKKVKVITILTVLCALIAIISAFSGYLLALYLTYKFNIYMRDAGSVGIIGGAEGPTSIYLSGQISSNRFTVVFATLAILGVIYLIFSKYSTKSDK